MPSKPSCNGRDPKTGRFAKGNKWSTGRPPVPEKIRDLAKTAPERLEALASDADTDRKLKADIYKWAYECVYGRPTQRVEAEIENDAPIALSLAEKGRLLKEVAEAFHAKGE